MVCDQIVQAGVSSNYASGLSSLIALPSVFDPRVREQGGEGHGTTTKCHEDPFLTSFCVYISFGFHFIRGGCLWDWSVSGVCKKF